MSVDCAGRAVFVRELRWLDALEFLKLLAAQAGAFFDPASGQFRVDFAQLAELVGKSQALAEWLLTRSTGLTAAELADLPFRAALELLDASLAVNLNEDLQARLKKIGGRLKFAGPAAASAAPPPPNPPPTTETAP